jgi:2-phospho-L-lactate guanylyltransferase
MTTVVVPFAGTDGKTRLDAPPALRRELSLAMLADVLAAAVEVGRTLVVTPDDEVEELVREAGAERALDMGGGQGPAVHAAIAAIAGPVLVLNADLPCATPGDLRAVPLDSFAIVEARDGTTNAVGMSTASRFEPVYGHGSAARFRALGAVPVRVPNLEDDVDTTADLERLVERCGAHTRAVLAAGGAR